MGFITSALPGGTAYGTNTTGMSISPYIVWASPMTLPVGRAMLDGSTDVIPSEVQMWIGGASGTISVHMRVGAPPPVGTGSAPVGGSATGTFSVPVNTGSPPYHGSTGWRTLAHDLRTGGSTVVAEIRASAGLTFSRRLGTSSERTYRVGGPAGGSWDTGIVGSLRSLQAPTAPGTPSAIVSGTNADVSWDASSDDGGAAITGYRLHVDTDPGFPAPTEYDQAGLTKALSGLAPATYYVRVAAKNEVTTAAGTTSVWSSTGTFTVIGGVRVKVSGAYVSAIPYVKQGGVYVAVTPYVKQGGVYVATD